MTVSRSNMKKVGASVVPTAASRSEHRTSTLGAHDTGYDSLRHVTAEGRQDLGREKARPQSGIRNPIAALRFAVRWS